MRRDLCSLGSLEYAANPQAKLDEWHNICEKMVKVDAHLFLKLPG